MAFTQSTFASVGAHSADTPNLYSYSSDDDVVTVTATGYFINKKFQLGQGDWILSALADGHMILIVQSDTSTALIWDTAPKLVLLAFSQNNQEPAGLDDPLQVEYGGAQGTINDPVMIDANGTVTINEEGIYDIVATYRVGRLGSAGGTAHIYIRGLLNGIQVDNPTASLVTSPEIVIPQQFEVLGLVEAGSVLTAEVARDGGGTNEGGLYADTTTGALDWGTAASAAIRIYKSQQ